MKWVLIYVLYAHTPQEDYRHSASIGVATNHIVFDDQQACENARLGIVGGAFNRSYQNSVQEDSKFRADAACVPQSSTNGPIR